MRLWAEPLSVGELADTHAAAAQLTRETNHGIGGGGGGEGEEGPHVPVGLPPPLVRPSAGWAEKGRIAVMVIRLGAQIRFIARVVKCSNSNREEEGEWGVREKTERQ